MFIKGNKGLMSEEYPTSQFSSLWCSWVPFYAIWWQLWVRYDGDSPVNRRSKLFQQAKQGPWNTDKLDILHKRGGGERVVGCSKRNIVTASRVLGSYKVHVNDYRVKLIWASHC